MKTVQTIAKRIKVTKRKKFLITPAGQSHFRSRKSGATKMKKRSDRVVAAADVKNIKRAMPYR